MNNQAEKMLILMLNSSDFNSLLDYYGQYYVCFDRIGCEVEISKEDFNYLCSLVKPEYIVRAE